MADKSSHSYLKGNHLDRTLASVMSFFSMGLRAFLDVGNLHFSTKTLKMKRRFFRKFVLASSCCDQKQRPGLKQVVWFQVTGDYFSSFGMEQSGCPDDGVHSPLRS